jgi:hypothetical protein
VLICWGAYREGRVLVLPDVERATWDVRGVQVVVVVLLAAAIVVSFEESFLATGTILFVAERSDVPFLRTITIFILRQLPDLISFL